MEQRSKAKKGGRPKKREWMLGAGLIAYLIGLIIRIPLSHMIGDKGIGFFAAGIETVIVISALLSYGISRAVMVLIKYRIKRKMYKSAQRVMRTALFMTVTAGIIAAAGVFLFSEWIAETVVLEHMSYLAIAAAAPAVFFSAVIGVLRGYFQGMGTMVPTVHSRLIEKFIMFAASLILGYIMYSYGQKVSALLKSEEYAFAYGAAGAALGLSVACGFALLHLTFIYMAYAGNFKQQLLKDSSKYTESGGQSISILFSTALPYMLCALLYNINYLIDQRLFNYSANLSGQSGIRASHWGAYYGKYSIIAGIPAVFCALAGIVAIPRIIQSYERKEYRDAQSKVAKTIHYLAIISIPCAVIAAVLAEPLVEILFAGDKSTAVRMVQAGSSVIVFFALTYFFAGVLQRIRKIRIVILAGFIAFLFHLILLNILLKYTELGIIAVVLGMVAFWLVACVVCLVGIIRYMQYTQEWIRTFAVPLIAAGIAGLIGMLLCKIMLAAAGSVITFLVCLVICVIVYHVLLIVLRGVREDELVDMPGGRVIAAVAERLHLL